MTRCDRARFFLWAEGVLFERDASGLCLVGDWDECESAGEALARGESVELTVRGVAVSVLEERGDEYVETRCA